MRRAHALGVVFVAASLACAGRSGSADEELGGSDTSAEEEAGDGDGEQGDGDGETGDGDGDGEAGDGDGEAGDGDGEAGDGDGEAGDGDGDPLGCVEWTRQFGGEWGETVTDLALDPAGNLYVAGYAYGGLVDIDYAAQTDAFVRKYDSEGNELWTRGIRSEGEGSEFAYGVEVGGPDEIYVVGTTTGPLDGQPYLGYWAAFVTRFNDEGDRLWTRVEARDELLSNAHGVLGPDGHVHLVADTFTAIDAEVSDVVVLSFDADGEQLWSTMFGTDGLDGSSDIAVDPAGNIYVGGFGDGVIEGEPGAGDADALVARLAPTGELEWLERFGSNARDNATGIAADADSVYVSATTNGALPGHEWGGDSDFALARYEPDGTLDWVVQWGDEALEQSRAVELDAFGQVLVVGNRGASPNIDNFLVRYDLDGNQVGELSSYGTALEDSVEGIGLGPAGEIYIGGLTLGQFPEADPPVDEQGDAFVSRLCAR